MKALIGVALLCCILKGASAWHGNGHYITAYIAQQWLLENNYDALKWANDILIPFKLLCGENLYPFVESATWLDKIKDQGWHTLDNHHFTPAYWYDEGAKPTKEFDPATYSNATFAINDAIKTLSAKNEDPYGSSKNILGKSFAMRELTHLVGDIHQPLHTEERVTPERPESDRGGNDFIIKHYNDKYMDNLHFIWDEMFEDYSESIRTNLPKDKYLFIKAKGDLIMQEYPLSKLKAQIDANNTAAAWALEGLDISKNFAYKGIKEREAFPEQYMKEGAIICKQRVALGGYRLGMIIDNIYKKLTKPVPPVKSSPTTSEDQSLSLATASIPGYTSQQLSN